MQQAPNGRIQAQLSHLLLRLLFGASLRPTTLHYNHQMMKIRCWAATYVLDSISFLLLASALRRSTADSSACPCGMMASGKAAPKLVAIKAAARNACHFRPCVSLSSIFYNTAPSIGHFVSSKLGNIAVSLDDLRHYTVRPREHQIDHHLSLAIGISRGCKSPESPRRDIFKSHLTSDGLADPRPTPWPTGEGTGKWDSWCAQERWRPPYHRAT